MSFVNLGGDAAATPTYFEVVAADRIVPSLKSAVVYTLSVLSQRRSWVHRLLAYEDEVLALVSLVLDWHSLHTADATFAESLYGLCRRRIPGPAPPQAPGTSSSFETGVQAVDAGISERQRRLGLAVEVLVPYLRSKAGQLHKLHAGEGVLGLALQNSASRQRAGDCDRQSSWAGYARRLLVRAFVTAYPWCHAAMESSTLAYHIAYLLRVAPTHRPTLHALRMQVSRVSAQDMARLNKAKEATRQARFAAAKAAGQSTVISSFRQGLLHAIHFISDNARNSLIVAVFAFKALEWWYTSAEEHLAAGKALPVPPPPPPPRPSPKGVGLPADTSHCPVCRKACMNPAQVATSGYLGCYPCVFSYVQEHGLCPVTQVPTLVDHVRKLYDTM
uniref:Peroxisome biogenesis protein 12 n=1 Tax=Dunaliella tertiolecta TaxID=3047 RepID=A0A7S3VUL7_DUNTE|mmetsp:Transcript_29089/g.78364  ORF Transcript_29089/g.78364 Transcript_29089/m.78364 type:complete len:389 (+) Transcript_29089:214-1380(+)|eukprot:CAMPEP_0202342980 /NCGR_PEP_ID=MMETSP1126-20121109/3308_1 /ASSEMBLY_ACC=CAM_ASM_000457 /TAXON_ID=3047 /ORGANISM="Dunaliella tertiolecta, Strain CCMP1320" /LENGTH=388 /DNA_ID=CAMNT_0048934005 /DNA_START=142 /DNA_END=1308 /DNA_ORIENTATION=+